MLDAFDAASNAGISVSEVLLLTPIDDFSDLSSFLSFDVNIKEGKQVPILDTRRDDHWIHLLQAIDSLPYEIAEDHFEGYKAYALTRPEQKEILLSSARSVGLEIVFLEGRCVLTREKDGENDPTDA